MSKKFELQTDGDFTYLETNPDSEKVILLLHGLMGALSNFTGIINHFSADYNVVMPQLPIFTMPLRKLGVSGLVDYLSAFIKYKDYKDINLLGNSLGGHIGQLYTLDDDSRVKSLTLTGSSGLFESAMGNTFPKRGNFEYMKKKIESVFYDPATASDELVQEVFETVNNRNMAIRIVATAKSAVRHNLANKLHEIKVPTLLIWGKQDEVTPPFVAEKFLELIENSTLAWVDKCGHAPMMERPEEFNRILEEFLNGL